MNLLPREIDKLLLHGAGTLAQKRLARGLRLSYPEAVALIAAVLLELIRDGRSVAALMDVGRRILGRAQVLEGVAELIHDVQVEGTFEDGVKLVTVHHPIALEQGDLALALHGSFLPVPKREAFARAAAADGQAVAKGDGAEPAVAGEVLPAEGFIELNQGRATAELVVQDAITGAVVNRVQYSALSAGINSVLWDGKTSDGRYAAPGTYRLGVTAFQANGFRSLSSYTPGTFEGWLHRITTNLFLDMVRRKARIRFDALPDDAERIPGRERSPQQVYDDQHFDGDVQAALDALPPDFRAAVVLCDLEGLSYDEIAATLGIKIGTVRSRIHRGRSQLRAALAHRAPGVPTVSMA